VPVLPRSTFSPTRKAFPSSRPSWNTVTPAILLPQWYADQFGWEEIVAETAIAWNKLTPKSASRENCGIFAQDYGQAGAIDFLGRRYGLPPALSGHQTWFLWGPRGYSGNCMIVLGDSREKLEQLWDHVEYVGQSADNPYALEKQIASSSAVAQSSAPSPTLARAKTLALEPTKQFVSVLLNCSFSRAALDIVRRGHQQLSALQIGSKVTTKSFRRSENFLDEVLS
jgi:hypothetical protein